MSYTVTQLHGEPRPFETQQGRKLVGYWMTLEGVPERVNWNRSPDADPPKVGESYDLALEEKSNSNGKYFKATLSKQGSFAGNTTSPSSSTGGGKDWEASGRAQGRAHAQEMAIRWFALKGTAPNGLSDLTQAIDWFYDDAQAALEAGYRS